MKLANIKIIWSKLETKEQSNKMLIYLVRTGSSRNTRNRKPDPTHWSFGCSHSHISPSRLTNLAKHKPVSTFSFSRTSICFSWMRRFPTQVLSRLLQVRRERMRFMTRWWAAFRVKSFKAAVSSLQVRGTLLMYAYKMAANPPTIPKRLTCKWRLGYFPSL